MSQNGNKRFIASRWNIEINRDDDKQNIKMS